MEPVYTDLNRITESIERNQRDIQRARHELRDHNEKLESGIRHVRILWAIVIVLVLALAGTFWYGYKLIENHSAALADLGQIPGLQKLVNAIDGRLTSTEGKVSDWPNDRASLTDRISKLETALRSNVEAARSQAETAAKLAGRRVRDEINQSLARLESRMTSVESVQHETHDQLAAAQTEIGSLRQQIAGLQQQNAERASDLERTQADVNTLTGQLTSVNSQVKTHTAGLKELNDQVDRERKPFELSTSKTEQVAPQIYLTVSHTDVAHQKVDGWMQFADEGRIVWIHGLAAQQALTFVTRSDNRTHALVFTGIQGSGATGYLLMPRAVQTPAASAN